MESSGGELKKLVVWIVSWYVCPAWQQTAGAPREGHVTAQERRDGPREPPAHQITIASVQTNPAYSSTTSLR